MVNYKTNDDHEFRIKYEELLQSIDDVVFETDKQGYFVYFNDLISKYSGYKSEELIGRHFGYLIDPEDLDRITLHFKNQIKAKKTHSFIRFLIVTKKGEKRWVSQKTNFYYTTKGEYQKSVAVVRDVDKEVQDEKKLIAKSQLLESVITTMSAGVFVMNLKGEFLLTNNAAKQLLLTPTEISNLKDWSEIYDVFTDKKKSVLNGEELYFNFLQEDDTEIIGSEFYIKNKSTKLGAYIRVNANRLKDDQDQTIGAVIVASDITSRKQKQLEIQEKAVWLEQSQSLAQVGYWEVDLLENTVFWSEETRKIHEAEEGYVPNLEEGINFYDEESIPIITNAVTNAIANNAPFDHKLKIITAKGNKKWVRTIGKAQYHGDTPVKLTGVFQDITKDKKLEEKLIARDKKIQKLNAKLEKKVEDRTLELSITKNKYEILYNDAPDLMASIDVNTGLILNCNDTALEVLGYNRSDLIDNSVFNIYHEDSYEEARKAFEIFRTTGKLKDFKMNLQTKSNNKIPVILNVNAVRDDNGNIIYSNSIWRDRTDIQKAENELIELNNELEKRIKERTKKLELLNTELEDFTYITTHDLKSPIVNIIGFNSIIKKETAHLDNSKIKMAVEYIEKSTDQASRKIKSLVEIAKLKTNSGVEWHNLNIEKLVTAAINELESEIKASNAIINLDIQVKELFFNQRALNVALVNLIGNAIKYKDQDRDLKIQIRVLKKKKNTIIEVEDNGMGIDLEKHKDKIFGMFSRLHNHTEGDGMGLHYTKKILNNNNTTITVSSKTGEGSCFKIKVPTTQKKYEEA